ncbi:transcription initiation factor iia subunit 2 [Diplodia corticola]|uniref:Transcription initiation factor iia subunit 2 n=1 Tax=Diplodia corticola TaxID=236234 RepID=A0A1J9SDW9_9PEZI|nr:transcription initiation factor iia subunit 2 [Diplodia corticola]OJD37781.1 transcription initiation factor iia subunit 2 [Diplodia corticola]
MPRKLPWLTEKPDPPLAEARVKKRRLQSPDLSDALDDIAPTPRRKGQARATRTPSSSPPPQPPKQEFMRDGFAADDIWMMVENEFLDTARAFTRHLHHAEYHRLKRVAREKNASAAQNIVRPVVPRSKMSVESQLRHEAKARAERQAEGLRRIEGGNIGADEPREEPEEEVPWARDPHLGGLMSGSQDSTSRLATLAGIKSKTRAAAGYSGAQSKPSPTRHKEARPRSSFEGLARETRRAAVGSDEDDLDAFSSGRRSMSKESVRRPSGTSTKTADAREPSMLPPRHPKQSEHNNSSLTKQSPNSKGRTNVPDRLPPSSGSPGIATSTSTSSKPSRRKVLTSKFTFLDSFGGPDGPSDKAKDDSLDPKQPARPSVKKEKEKKFIPADEIPTFLF